MIKRLTPTYEYPKPLPFKGVEVDIQLMYIDDKVSMIPIFYYKVFGKVETGIDLPWLTLTALVIGDPEKDSVALKARNIVTRKWNRLMKELKK